MTLLGYAIALGLSLPPMPPSRPLARRSMLSQPMRVAPIARPTPTGQPIVSPVAPPLALPPAPMPAQCGPAGCLLPDGRRATPAGPNFIDPSGRTCVQSGAILQCR